MTSLAGNLITPIIGVFGHYDFSTLSVVINGSTFAYGNFLNSLISFIVITAAVYFFVVRPISRVGRDIRKKKAIQPATKACPQCLSTIPLKAKRCAYCTSILKK